ncbi:MAG: 7-cyano-7-deazaguanine synthase [Candidatus Omnitrophota bacterium]
MAIRAISLFSGGLDSTLATKVAIEAGVEVEAFYFVIAFASGYRQDAPREHYSDQERIAQGIGAKLRVVDISQEHLEMVRNPRYGYGRNLNPCIDCKIFMLKKAKEFIEQEGFSFIITGEVLGQRPMSQRRDTLDIIARDSGCKGLVLRPLSARLLTPTIAEEQGWIEREALHAFSGRSRKPQLELAKQLGVKKYLTPAGGCLLTEAEFVQKVQRLGELGAFDHNDIQLLKVGRHFFFNQAARIIVGRDEEENKTLETAARPKDMLMKMRDLPGPLTIVRANASSISAEAIAVAAEVTARYSKAKDRAQEWVEYWTKEEAVKKSIAVKPADTELLKRLRV